MRKLVGLDLNGWRDLAWRSWATEDGDIVDAEEGHVVEGGYAAVAVKPTERPRAGRRRTAWIGGPQALLAPHGQGEGFGAVGRAPRVPLREASFAAGTETTHAMTAAVLALAAGGDIGALAIPDDGTCGETQRELLLSAMRDAGLARRILVWRPVLCALARPGLVGTDRTLAVVSQVEDGLSVQRLVIRRDDGIEVPERKAAGRLVPSPCGLRARETAARAALLTGRDDRFGLAAAIARSDLPVRLTLGAPAEPRLARLTTGAWTEIRPLDLPQSSAAGLDTSLAEDADTVLLDSPAEGASREALRRAVARDLGRDVEGGDPADAVRGAFAAALRLARGQPVHYDFLPQIETICDGPEGPHSFPLVEEGARLRAGEIYRSEVPARFRLPARLDRVTVWLDRAESERPRKAEIPVPESAQAVDVALHLEQVPAAGRARLTLRSPTWPTPREVLWEEAEEDPRDWETIIADLDPRPGWPDPWRIESSPLAWRMLATSPEARRATKVEWPTLAQWFGQSSWGEQPTREKGHLLDSRGDPPPRTDPRLLAWIDQHLSEGAAAVERASRRGAAPPDHCLKTLTWTFGRCPRPVFQELIRAVSAKAQGRKHPFDGPGQVKLWLHGLGRIARTPDEARTAFDALFRFPDDFWTEDHAACAAFLLSRIEEGWSALSNDEPRRLLRIACRRLDHTRTAQTGSLSYWRRLHYNPPLIAGLLRRRQGSDRYALLEGRDPDAAEVARRLDLVLTDLKPLHDRQAERWRPLLKELLAFIREGAGDSGILQRMLADSEA